MIDIVASAPNGAVIGSYDGVSFTDPTQSTVAFVSGDPTKPAGNMNLGGIVYGLEADNPCTGNNQPPCTISGTLLVNSASGPLFGDGGGTITNFAINPSNTVFVNDPQNPGVNVSGASGHCCVAAHRERRFRSTARLNLASLRGAATLDGGIASITCGGTGNGMASLTSRHRRD